MNGDSSNAIIKAGFNDGLVPLYNTTTPSLADKSNFLPAIWQRLLWDEGRTEGSYPDAAAKPLQGGLDMPFPVEEQFIERAEAELGARFPESFRNKMMRLNGGCVQWPNEDEVDEDEVEYYELHPFYDTSDKKRIKRTCNSIVHETKTYRDKYGLPENLIVLADNDGDLLVYKIEDNGKIDPKVYWRDRDTEELVLIANDFSELKEDVL